MATQFTWICHAATAAMRTGAFPADEPIDSKGLAQAVALAPSLPKADLVWISPALRSRQTADALGLTGVVEPALRECDYGRWSGRSLVEIHQQDESGLRTWLSDPSCAPHGGEALTDLIKRIGVWIDAQDHRAGDAIVVTHAGVIRAAVIHIIQAAPASFSRIDIAPLSRTIFSAREGQWRLASLGCHE